MPAFTSSARAGAVNVKAPAIKAAAAPVNRMYLIILISPP
jgi:hypothetical protein